MKHIKRILIGLGILSISTVVVGCLIMLGSYYGPYHIQVGPVLVW